MQESKLVLTEDGSHSIYSDHFAALYHSKHGAVQESQHVFIQSGLFHLNKKSLSILEMGFGTGLNALLTLIEAQKKDIQVTYKTLEAYPLPKGIISKLNYVSELGAEGFEPDFNSLHSAPWNEELVLQNFHFTKLHKQLQDAEFDEKFDLVFYDAFAPQTQEELWTPEIFQHIARFLNPGAVLVSYCAKGSFKRALISAGFTIEKIPGPPGKREMIRGTYSPTI